MEDVERVIRGKADGGIAVSDGVRLAYVIRHGRVYIDLVELVLFLKAAGFDQLAGDLQERHDQVSRN